VSDAGNFNSPPWQILKFDENGENPEVFISENLAWPQDILFIEDQNIVLISNLNTGNITKYDLYSGSYIDNFATGIGGPTRMKIGPDSLLYVLQWTGNGKVWRYQIDGTFVDEFTDVGVPQSIGIDWDSTGNLYVSSFTGDFVRKFDTSGTDMGLFVNTNLLGPTNIWFDSNDELLVADYNSTAIKRFDSSGVYLNDFITGLSNCEGVDFFPNGDILIGNGGTSSVKLFNSNGTYISDLITSGSGNLLTPNAIVIREIDSTAASVIDKVNVLNNNPELDQNYPNPFNPTTSIPFTLSKSSRISIDLFNILGQKIKTLVNDVYQAGSHTIKLDGNELAAGVYFYRMKVNDKSKNYVSTRRMLLLE
jgi:hypothetical protein